AEPAARVDLAPPAAPRGHRVLDVPDPLRARPRVARAAPRRLGARAVVGRCRLHLPDLQRDRRPHRDRRPRRAATPDARPRMNRPPLRLDVPEDAAGARLDAFLAAREGSVTRSAWKRAIEEGLVRVSGRVVSKPGWPLKAGSSVEAIVPVPPPTGLTGEDIAITIVHEDEDLVV